MELSRISTISIVVFVCAFFQEKGDTNLMFDDEDFTSGSGDKDTRGQYELILYVQASLFI